MRNLQIYAMLDFQLKEMVKVDMMGMLSLDIDTPNGAAKVIVDGDLVLKQTGPIVFDSNKRTIYKENPFSVSLISKHSMTELLELYHERTEKIEYKYEYLIQPIGNPYKTVIQIYAHVPVQQEVKYVPGILETLKFAWVQFLALLVPSLLIFRWISGFLFRYEIIETNITSDLKKTKRFH